MEINTSDDAAEVIKKIAETPSTNEKKEILGAHPKLKAIVEWTYDPYKRFYINKFPKTVRGRGNKTFNHYTWRILDGLSSRTLSGNRGRDVTYTHIRTLTPDSGELMKRVITKDLKWGMGATLINEVWPGHIPQHNILLAEDLEPDRISFPCFASIKIDGLRGTYKEGSFWTRTGKRYKSLDRFAKQFGPWLDQFGVAVDGELYLTDAKNFDELSGRLRSHKDQGIKTVRFFVFDLMMTELKFYQRVNLMEGISWPLPQVTCLEHHVMWELRDITNLFSRATEKKFEGIVVKSWQHKYHGKRSFDWMRLVTEHTGDGTLVDVEEGTGKNAGAAGALIVNYKGKYLRIGPGKMTYDERKEVLNNQVEYIGSWCRFVYKGRTENGKLRQPRWDRWRNDI